MNHDSERKRIESSQHARRSPVGPGVARGEVPVGHHALSKFRVGHQAALDKLMTDILGALLHKGVLSLRLVA
jgi:hypothetical protein